MSNILRKQGINTGGGGGGADIKKATYEETTALHNHSVGDLIVMMDNNTPTLYKVTDAITAGDTIALGTNITDNTGVSADMQVYADGLEDGSESGGSEIISSSDFFDTSSMTGVSICKTGNIITLTGTSPSVSPSTWTNIATIKSIYRPKILVRTIAHSGAIDQWGNVYIDTQGVIHGYQTSGSGQFLNFSIVYPI